MNLNKSCSQYMEFLVILSLSFLFQFVMSRSLTPLVLSEGYDSVIFKQMGLSILQGKELYTDLFDHKGPIIFFVNAIGQWLISGKMGLFVLYSVYISFVLYLWYKISRLFVENRVAAMAPVILGLLFLYMASNEDNETEDWSLLSITYALYLFSKFYQKNHVITRKEYFFLGIGMGIVVFMRINNMVVNCCVIFVLAITFLQKHRLSDLKNMIIYVVYGMLLITVLVFIVMFAFYGRHGVEQMIYGTFTYNFEYMGAVSQAVAPDRGQWYVRFGLSVAFFIVALYIKYKNDLLPHLLLFCYLATFIAIGTKGWLNYFILFSPLFAISAAALNVGLNKWVRHSIVLVMLVYLGKPFIDRIRSNEDELAVFYQRAHEIMSHMGAEERGRIWNHAHFTGLSVLQKEGLTQANRVMLDFQWEISEKLKQGELERFETIKPPYVFMTTKIEDEPNLYDTKRIVENYELMEQVEVGARLFVYKKVRNW